jgi:hypothetical protein
MESLLRYCRLCSIVLLPSSEDTDTPGLAVTMSNSW